MNKLNMKMRLIFLNAIFVIVVCSCCNLTEKDFYLSKNQYDYIKSFKEGDTICFENQTTHDLDTILINSIDSVKKHECGWINALPAYNHIYISIIHLPVDNWAGTVQEKNLMKTKYQSIISIEKNAQTKIVSISITYRDFYASFEDSLGSILKNDLQIGKVILKNYFILKPFYKDHITKDFDIEEIYWTSDLGLTGYKTKNNQLWIKKNNTP